METSDLARKILQSRGVESEPEQDRFLNPQYEHLHDPFGLPDMRTAADRLEAAAANNDKVVVYGDYDIDGLSATALLLDALKAADIEVSAYIPNRFDEGYGINTAAIEALAEAGTDLVITVDCGSTSHKPLQRARDLGVDVIVTDHHLTDKQLPPALAIINPKRKDSNYAFSDLAGVGVAFKLAQSLVARGLLPQGREKWLLDLVALGTVCDVVELVDENRVLVTYGLKVFGKTQRIGLRALMAVSGVESDRIDTYTFGFVLGPRLNAAGRLEHARLALEVLTADEKPRAVEAAKRLDELNYQRRQQQQRITEEAMDKAAGFADDPVLVLSDPDWNHGVVGIVAAKLVDRLHKPTLILQEMDGEAKGSARSPEGFDIAGALASAGHLLNKYGGHKVAAGCSLDKDKIAQLRRQMNDYFRKGGYGNLKAELNPDITIDSVSELDMEAYERLEQLAPFGRGNPRPLLRLDGVGVNDRRLVGSDKRHVKCRLEHGAYKLDAIAFGMSEKFESISTHADVLFELDNNRYNGTDKLQAKIISAEPWTG